MFGIKPMEIVLFVLLLAPALLYVLRDPPEHRREATRVFFHALAAAFFAIVLLNLWSAYQSNGW